MTFTANFIFIRYFGRYFHIHSDNDNQQHSLLLFVRPLLMHTVWQLSYNGMTCHRNCLTHWLDAWSFSAKKNVFFPLDPFLRIWTINFDENCNDDVLFEYWAACSWWLKKNSQINFFLWPVISIRAMNMIVFYFYLRTVFFFNFLLLRIRQMMPNFAEDRRCLRCWSTFWVVIRCYLYPCSAFFFLAHFNFDSDETKSLGFFPSLKYFQCKFLLLLFL